MILGSIEAGGTKFVCGIGNEQGEVLERISIPTKTPDETIPEVIEFFKKRKVDAIGIGTFGPIDVKKIESNLWSCFKYTETGLAKLSVFPDCVGRITSADRFYDRCQRGGTW